MARAHWPRRRFSPSLRVPQRPDSARSRCPPRSSIASASRRSVSASGSPPRGSKGAAAPAGGDLTLLTAPKMIADELGMHNVEMWSAQFAETTARLLQTGQGGRGGRRVEDHRRSGRRPGESLRSGRGEARGLHHRNQAVDGPRRGSGLRRACGPTRAAESPRHGTSIGPPIPSGSSPTTARRSASRF